MYGIKISTFVTVVLPQDKLLVDNVLVQHQLLFGTEILVYAQPTLSDPTVFHAQLQDSGIKTTVFVLKIESGTDKIVFALLDFMDQTVFLAQLQDSGTIISVNVFAHKTEFGMVKIVFVPQDSMVPIVNHAHCQEDGWTTDVIVKPHLSGTEMPVFVQLELMDHHVLHAQLQENGIQALINASVHHQWLIGMVMLVFAQPTHLDLNVSHVQLQELGTIAQTNVFAQLQWHSGMVLNAFAQLTLSDLNVSHAQLQEPGTIAQTNVFVQLQKPSGMEINVYAQQIPSVETVSHAHLKNIGMKQLKHVFAQILSFGTDNIVFVNQDSMVQIVSHAHLKSIGTNNLKLVFAQHHLSGAEFIAFAHQDGLWSTDNVADAQLDMNGKITNASTVTASIFLQSGGQNQVPLLDQLDQQLPLLLLMFAQLDQFGMMLLTNVFTAHYQTSLSKRTPQLENGNASATAHSDLLPILMVLDHANDWDLFSLLFYILFQIIKIFNEENYESFTFKWVYIEILLKNCKILMF